MRKITTNALNAFLTGVPFASGNTTVTVLQGQLEWCRETHVKLFLHGNCIAQYELVPDAVVFIRDCGFATRTTFERIKPLLGMLFKKNHVAYYSKEREGYAEEWPGHTSIQLDQARENYILTTGTFLG